MAVGLTPADVFAACEALAARGVPVEAITGHAAWIQLGRGSKSTVQKYWKEWRALQERTSPLSRAGALSAIQDTIDRLVEQAVAEERDRAGAKIAELEEEVRQLSRILALALSDIERSEKNAREAANKADAAMTAGLRAEAQRDLLKHELKERDQELEDALIGRRNRAREVADAAGRLSIKLRRPER